MKIGNALLELKTGRVGDFPEGDIPEIAFAGRSNVGKSSMINRLLHRKNLAPVGSAPGKTKALYFYRINGKFYLVDLPGYGYAKVSQKLRREWGELMKKYLTGRRQLQGCIQVMDIRHPPSELDRQMAEWLMFYGVSFLVAATKADKISRGRYSHSIKLIQEALFLKEDIPVIPFSGQTGEGKDEIWHYINQFMISPQKRVFSE